MKQSLKWEQSQRRAEFPGSREGTSWLSLGTPAGMQPGLAQGSHKQTQPVLSRALGKQSTGQDFVPVCKKPEMWPNSLT